MARPRKEIDPKKVKAMASIGCTLKEMALVLGCSEDTLQRRQFAAIVEQGQATMKQSLRRKQYNKAVKEGNVAMLIWLGKQLLGQRDVVDIDSTNLNSDDMSPEQLERLLAQRLDRMAKRAASSAAAAPGDASQAQ